MALSYAATVLQDSPVCYLRFEETSGTNCADSSGNNRPGTTHGSVGRNIAMGFSGIDIGVQTAGSGGSFVSVANDATMQTKDSISWEIWVNMASAPGSQSALMSQGVTGTNEGWVVYITTTLGIKIANTNTGTVIVQTANNALSTNTSHHVVFTRDGSNVNTIYIDGSQSAQTTTAANHVANSEVFAICGSTTNGTAGVLLPASVDEFAYYNAVLSSTRVSAHYAARNTAQSSGSSVQVKSPPPSVIGRVPGGPKQHKPPKPRQPPPQPGVERTTLVDGELRKQP